MEPSDQVNGLVIVTRSNLMENVVHLTLRRTLSMFKTSKINNYFMITIML